MPQFLPHTELTEIRTVDLFNGSFSGDFTSVVPTATNAVPAEGEIVSLAVIKLSKDTRLSTFETDITDDLIASSGGSLTLQLQSSPDGASGANADADWTNISTVDGTELDADMFLRIRVTSFQDTQGSFHLRITGLELE